MKHTKQELDSLAEEFRQSELITLHLALITWNPEPGSEYYKSLWTRGKALATMKPVELRKLKEYKRYVRDNGRKRTKR